MKFFRIGGRNVNRDFVNIVVENGQSIIHLTIHNF